MMNIYRRDLSEQMEFDRIGYHYTNVKYDPDKHIGIWAMDGGSSGYEVIKGVKRCNPDGQYVYVYPCDEQFGTYGWYYVGTDAWEHACTKYMSL